MIDEPVVSAAGSATNPNSAVGEQAEVGRQPPQVLREQRGLEQRGRLGLAARELHRGHRLVGPAKPERARRRLAVEREDRHAVARGGAERVLVGAPARPRAAPRRRRAISGGEARGPERHRRGHRRAAGGCSRAAASRPNAARDAVQRRRDRVGLGGQARQLVLQPEPQRRQHLVVARAPEVDPRRPPRRPAPSAGSRSRCGSPPPRAPRATRRARARRRAAPSARLERGVVGVGRAAPARAASRRAPSRRARRRRPGARRAGGPRRRCSASTSSSSGSPLSQSRRHGRSRRSREGRATSAS